MKRFARKFILIALALCSCSKQSEDSESQSSNPILTCAPLSWSDTDLPADPAFYTLQPATNQKTNELPLLSTLPALDADRTTFITNTVARAQRIKTAYQNCNPTHKFTVGGVHFFAHENNIRIFSQTAVVNYVDMLNQAGVKLVGIHLGPYPWLMNWADAEVAATIAKYDAIIARIYALGMKPRFMLPISNSNNLPMTSWEDYTSKMKQIVQVLLNRYNLGVGLGQTYPLVQVGMHEPSSICETVPCGGGTDPALWRVFVDEVCDLAKSIDANVKCTASLIAGPQGGAGEWDFQIHALKSKADYLGVNNIDYYGIWHDKVGYSDTFIQNLKNGMTDPGNGHHVAGRGNNVFINAFWRPSFPQVIGELVYSNGTGLGCQEYQSVDDAYLEAIFTYGRAWGLMSINAFYTDTFVTKRACVRTTNMYTSVKDPSGTVDIDYFQEGNSLSDSLYRTSVRTTLEAGTIYSFSATGQKFKQLSSQFGQ